MRKLLRAFCLCAMIVMAATLTTPALGQDAITSLKGVTIATAGNPVKTGNSAAVEVHAWSASTSSSTVLIQQSLDGVHWYTVSTISNVALAGAFKVGPPSPWTRVYASVVDSGTISANITTLQSAQGITEWKTIESAGTSGSGITSATGTAPLTLGYAAGALTGSVAVTPTNPGGAMALQASTPGTAQTGNANLSGNFIAGLGKGLYFPTLGSYLGIETNSTVFSGTRDDVIRFGYNLDNTPGGKIATESASAMQIEANYLGTTEWILAWSSPSDPGPVVSRRPVQVNTDHTTAAGTINLSGATYFRPSDGSTATWIMNDGGDFLSQSTSRLIMTTAHAGFGATNPTAARVVVQEGDGTGLEVDNGSASYAALRVNNNNGSGYGIYDDSAKNQLGGALTATGSLSSPRFTSTGTAPTVAGTTTNSCGVTGAPSIAGKDQAGIITVGGTSATSCRVTFGAAFSNAPACVANAQTTVTALKIASTTGYVDISSAALTPTETISYVCLGF